MGFLDKSPFGSQTSALAVYPELAARPNGAAGLQRPLFRAGRTLGGGLLTLAGQTADQRQGRLGAFLGAGVREGFRVSLSDQDRAPGAFVLEPGTALSGNGQDLTLNTAQALTLRALPLLLLNPSDQGEAAFGDFQIPNAGLNAGIYVLMLVPIASFQAQPQQILADVAGFAWDQQRDGTAAPYADPLVTDGFIPCLVGVRDTGDLVSAPDGFNQATRGLISAHGAPTMLGSLLARHAGIAIFAVQADGAIAWVARHGAATRGGGLLSARVPTSLGNGQNPVQFQSGVDSLLEHYRQIAEDPEAVSDVSERFQTLPAAGILPLGRKELPEIFPKSWDFYFGPLPESELSAVLAGAQALAPFDLSAARDEVVMHLVVSDALYDPELLVRPEVSPLFDEAIERFEQNTARHRAHRDLLYEQAAVVQGVLDTSSILPIGKDDDELPNEGSLTAPETPETPPHQDKAQALFQEWRDQLPENLITPAQSALLRPDSEEPRSGVVPFQTLVVEALKPADDFIDFGFTRVQAEIYRLRQSLLENEESTKLATFPILAGIVKGSNALATNRALTDYFTATKKARVSEGVEAQPVATLSATPTFATPAFMNLVGEAAGTAIQPDFATGLLSGSGSPTAAGTATVSLPVVAVQPIGSTFEQPRAGLLGGSALTSLGTATVVPMISGISTQVRYTEQAGYSLDIGKTTTAKAFDTSYLDQSYTTQNVYQQFFSEGRAATADEFTLTTLAEKQAGIKYANPLPGSFEDLRTVTVADRLTNSASIEARNSALRAKADMLSQLQSLEFSTDGLRAPIIALNAHICVVRKAAFDALLADPNLKSHEVDALTQASEEIDHGSDKLVLIDFGQALDGGGDLTQTMEAFRQAAVQAHTPLAIKQLVSLALRGKLDPPAVNLSDESAYMTAAVAILETVVAAYRATEARVAAIQGLVERTKTLIANLRTVEQAWKQELALVERELAEARHDVRVAMALKAEAVDRARALRDQRQEILKTRVRAVVYARPRRMRPHGAGLTAAHALPGLYEDPLADVLRTRADLPDELKAMMAVLRDIPINWFADREKIAPVFKRPKLLDHIMMYSVNSAAIQLNTRQTQAIAAHIVPPQPRVSSTPFGGRRKALESVLLQIDTFYQNLQARVWDERRKIDLGQLAQVSWAQKNKIALDRLSLGDVAAQSQDAAAAKEALAIVDRIERVLTALLARLRKAPPAVRLLWAEKLSVYDGETDLSDATQLPGWSGLSVELRRDILRFTDWLLRQMSASVPEARSLMSDVLQVAVLLSAHSDVEEIIAARLEKEQEATGGDIVEVVIDRGVPDIGRWVDLGIGRDKPPVRGTIFDLKGKIARVQIEKSVTRRVVFPVSTPVFIRPPSLSVGVRNVR